jgi:hypothetical protein
MFWCPTSFSGLTRHRKKTTIVPEGCLLENDINVGNRGIVLVVCRWFEDFTGESEFSTSIRMIEFRF